MGNKDINRLKVVLAEKKRTNKWLAEQVGKDPAPFPNGVQIRHNQTSKPSQESRNCWA